MADQFLWHVLLQCSGRHERGVASLLLSSATAGAASMVIFFSAAQTSPAFVQGLMFPAVAHLREPNSSVAHLDTRSSVLLQIICITAFLCTKLTLDIFFCPACLLKCGTLGFVASTVESY